MKAQPMYPRSRNVIDARALTPEAVAEAVAPVMERWDVARAWLYGSVARGDQSPSSDVDLIYEPMPTARIGLNVWDLEQELEEALGVAVDLHGVPDPRRANPAFIRNYERDKVMVYERTSGR